MNPKLEELLKTFRPRFGSTEDLAIIETIGRVRKLQESVDKHATRVQRLKGAIAKKTESEKRLEFQQNSLIATLEKLHAEQQGDQP